MSLRLMPIVYVSDVQASTQYYSALGFEPDAAARGGEWVELRAGDAVLALHGGPELAPTRPRRVELAMVADKPLEELLTDLRARGIEPDSAIVDEAFGRSVMLCDPDGLRIQVNEYDRDLYT